MEGQDDKDIIKAGSLNRPIIQHFSFLIYILYTLYTLYTPYTLYTLYHIRDSCFPSNNWVGSVGMGSGEGGDVGSSHSDQAHSSYSSPPSSPLSPMDTSALDERMRIRGVTNLIVADASAIPIVPRGQVHTTVINIHIHIHTHIHTHIHPHLLTPYLPTSSTP